MLKRMVGRWEYLSLVFHQVSIQKAGGYNLMSREAFLALPINERVQLILGNKVKFLDEKGDVIPTREALKSLREA